MQTSATISTFHVFDFNQCNLKIDKWTLTIFRCANITTSFPGYIKTFWRLDGAQCQKEIKSPGNEVANINIKKACVMWRQTLKLAVLSKYISTKIIFVWIFAQLCPLDSYLFLDAVQLSKNKKKLWIWGFARFNASICQKNISKYDFFPHPSKNKPSWIFMKF